MVGDILTIKNTAATTKIVKTTYAVGTEGGNVASTSLESDKTVTVIVNGAITITVS